MRAMGFPTEVRNFRIAPTPEISKRFRAAGIEDWHAALGHVGRLPYGRNRERGNPALVLEEGQGTCSSKHALLALLAGEQGQAVDLMLGIYEMSERNTPGVGPVLSAHGMCSLPEAHCYLLQGGRRIDVTRTIEAAEDPFECLLYEEKIVPSDVAEYKPRFHRRFLEEWLERSQAAGDHKHVDEVWEIREQCIRAIEQHHRC